MAKLLFMGVRGTDDPTTATMPFIMANGARESGHDAFIVLANDAVSLMRDVVRQNIHGVGWPAFAEIFARTVEHNVPIYVWTRCSKARGVTDTDLQGINARFTTPAEIAQLLAECTNALTF